MAARWRVLQSIETADGDRCVDIFLRPDGSYGFEEYRRDAEDGRGWFPIGFHADKIYVTEADARAAAATAVTWMVTVTRPQ